MPTVHFRSHKVDIDVENGATLFDAARRARIRLESPCHGGGTCGKCKVQLDETARAVTRIIGNLHLTAKEANDGWVLLCSTVVTGDITLDLPEDLEGGLRILEDGDRIELPLAPWITKRYVPARRTTEVWAGPTRIGEERGDTADRAWGVAVDIGSTTLVVSLINLSTGAQVGTISALNPQALHAQDVLSRIQIGSSAKGLELLHREVIDEINRLIVVLTTEGWVPRRRVYEVVFVGNTCMLHLAARVDPESLGRFPYVPNLSGAQHLPAASLGLKIAANGIVYLPPIISGFVGADITAGMLSARLVERNGVTLFVDIGTNGEMILARDGRLQATSTAAGPAFEGMNIACGMRASRGAIERVRIDDGDVTVSTIDDAPAIGLCGSGLLDAVSELGAHGVLEPSGRFTKKRDALPAALRARFGERDGKPVFYLTDEVFLSQGDIRQVQLAKGAVRAGIDVLLARNGLDPADVDRALIAGSFGYHLTVRSLIEIGMFPREFDGKVVYVGNTARTGAEALLTNAASRDTLVAQVTQVDAVELANDDGFTKTFVAAMAFPSRGREALELR